jgi:hypothetical protein
VESASYIDAPRLRAALAVFVCAAIMLATPVPSHTARGVPTDTSVHVTVDGGPYSVPSDGSFEVGVATRIDHPTPYLEIRFQLRRPSGQLLFQRTEVRNEVETGTVGVAFGRELADFELRPDAYPYEVRVRTEVGEPREQIVRGALLVHAPEPAVTPVALALRFGHAPSFDAHGRFVTDPDESEEVREALDTVARAVISEPSIRLSAIITPLLLEEWGRIASGYERAGPGGVTEVLADEAVPMRYRDTLAALREALATGRLELLHVPYADPDIAGLTATRSLHDLGAHYTRATSTYLATVESSPSAGTALSSNALNTAALNVMGDYGIAFALLGPDALVAEEDTATPGPWAIDGTRVTALVLDPVLGARMASADTTTAVGHVFDHAVSESATVPVAAVCDVGPGRTCDVEAVLDLARALPDIPWAEGVLASDAAASPVLGTARTVPIGPDEDAPAGYWDEIAEARRYAYAFEMAAGTSDPDARVVADSSLVAQSRMWAGPDGRWSMAERGRGFASAATRHARSFLDLVRVDANDVTLPGQRGDVPLGISNGSGKDLEVVLKVRGEGVRISGGGSERLALQPGDNFHTISVDLQSSLSSGLSVELWAAEVMLATTHATVRASYLDRLVTIGGVVAVLLGLLYYIRRRMRHADADKMPSRTS